MATPEPLTWVILIQLAGLPVLAYFCWKVYQQNKEVRQMRDEQRGRKSNE